MSHFDNLVTTIADGILAQADKHESKGPIVDVDPPHAAYVESYVDLTAIAKAIVAAGWVHVDELGQHRKAAS